LCRHPNYFGEITFWLGVYLFGLAAGASIYDSFYLTVFFLGPFAIFAIINFGSMPLMEERQMKRRTEFYTNYKKQVPFKLLPLSFLFKNVRQNGNQKSK
jgi:steroid 5-alpha reductase family enzyme